MHICLVMQAMSQSAAARLQGDISIKFGTRVCRLISRAIFISFALFLWKQYIRDRLL